MIANVGRAAVRKLLAVIEHGDAVAGAHHHFHVVLDQHDRHAGRLNAPDQADELAGFGAVQAGGRFVRQNQFRLADEGARNFEQPLMPVGQASGDHIRRRQQSHEIERLARAVRNFLFFLPLRARADQRMEDLAAGIGMQAHHDVLERGHLAKQPQILESAADTGGRAQIRPASALRSLAVKIYCAAGLADVTRNQIKKRGLPRTVWPDQAVHVAGLQPTDRRRRPRPGRQSGMSAVRYEGERSSSRVLPDLGGFRPAGASETRHTSHQHRRKSRNAAAADPHQHDDECAEENEPQLARTSAGIPASAR